MDEVEADPASEDCCKMRTCRSRLAKIMTSTTTKQTQTRFRRRQGRPGTTTTTTTKTNRLFGSMARREEEDRNFLPKARQTCSLAGRWPLRLHPHAAQRERGNLRRIRVLAAAAVRWDLQSSPRVCAPLLSQVLDPVHSHPQQQQQQQRHKEPFLQLEHQAVRQHRQRRIAGPPTSRTRTT